MRLLHAANFHSQQVRHEYMNRVRVVVTGLGVVSSVGIGWQPFWRSLCEGCSGIGEIRSFDTSDFPVHRGGEVQNFTPKQITDPRMLRRMNRASQFAVTSARMALEDASLDRGSIPDARIGVVIGTTMAEAQAIEAIDTSWVAGGVRAVASRLISQYPGNVIGAHVGSAIDSKGPNIVITTACSAGNYAIARAYDLMQLDRIDVAFAGGSDAFSRIAFMGFNRLYAMAPERCQPFDKNRSGMMLGEGSGILLLEKLEHATARGAQIYAEILGYGMSCDANHMTIPHVEGIKNVIMNALHSTNLSETDVDYISAHGTGTPANDRTESSAIRTVFGSLADRLPVSSIKSMLGHTMGAASALEAIACILAIHDQRVPPTINYETPDPECPIDCVPNVARHHRVRVALNNSFAFGGNNACLVLGAA